ncbi:MAG: hypothetical protein PHF84_03240 [bacterium]|nr:hypothetical protein [bacterium]
MKIFNMKNRTDHVRPEKKRGDRNRRRTRICILVCAFLLTVLVPCHSAFETTAAGGARVLGMANAFTAVENGGEGILDNPAAVCSVNKGSFTAMYSPLFTGLDDGSFNNGFVNLVCFFQKIGVFSLNWEFLTASTGQVTDLYTEDKIALTYSRIIKKDLYAGLVLNYYKWSSAKQTDPAGRSESLGSRAFSFGLSAFYRVREEFRLGLFINNINQPALDDRSRGNDDLERIPLEIRAGMAFYIRTLLVSLDMKFIREDVDILTGAEYWFPGSTRKKVFGVRLGFQLPDLGKGFNATAGLSVLVFRDFSVDYGFLIPVTTIKSIWGEHRFSMSYLF